MGGLAPHQALVYISLNMNRHTDFGYILSRHGSGRRLMRSETSGEQPCKSPVPNPMLARMPILGIIDPWAGMAESVDARDLKSLGPEGLCGFESRSRYQVALNGERGNHASR